MSSQTGWAFPFLLKADEWTRGIRRWSEKEVKKDLIRAWIAAIWPWSPIQEIRWETPDIGRERWVFIDAQFEFGRFAWVWGGE